MWARRTCKKRSNNNKNKLKHFAPISVTMSTATTTARRNEQSKAKRSTATPPSGCAHPPLPPPLCHPPPPPAAHCKTNVDDNVMGVMTAISALDSALSKEAWCSGGMRLEEVAGAGAVALALQGGAKCTVACPCCAK